MKVATWNVNSIRARLDRALAWLGKASPDVLCLQELKVNEDAFPFEALAEAGYKAAVLGQKTYNGVAVLSREEPDEVARRMGPDDADEQSRLIAARFGETWILSAYVPNGGEVGSPKWDYKLAWFDRLRAHLERTFSPETPLLLCGDLNVAPDDVDVANPSNWAGSVLCHPEARGALQGVMQWGLTDVFRTHHPDGGIYSWWDYRSLAFPRGDGLRIDHVLATAPLAGRCTSIDVDREERKGTKPSDHAPVVAVFQE